MHGDNELRRLDNLLYDLERCRERLDEPSPLLDWIIGETRERRRRAMIRSLLKPITEPDQPRWKAK